MGGMIAMGMGMVGKCWRHICFIVSGICTGCNKNDHFAPKPMEVNGTFCSGLMSPVLISALHICTRSKVYSFSQSALEKTEVPWEEAI